MRTGSSNASGSVIADLIVITPMSLMANPLKILMLFVLVIDYDNLSVVREIVVGVSVYVALSLAIAKQYLCMQLRK